MNVRVFVSSMACLLLAWLGLTFVRTVPHHGYPMMGRDGRPLTAAAGQSSADGVHPPGSGEGGAVALETPGLPSPIPVGTRAELR